MRGRAIGLAIRKHRSVNANAIGIGVVGISAVRPWGRVMVLAMSSRYPADNCQRQNGCDCRFPEHALPLIKSCAPD